jgi:hypothetical protein
MNPYPVICRLPESKGMWAFFWTNEDKKGRIVGKKIAGLCTGLRKEEWFIWNGRMYGSAMRRSSYRNWRR